MCIHSIAKIPPTLNIPLRSRKEDLLFRLSWYINSKFHHPLSQTTLPSARFPNIGSTSLTQIFPVRLEANALYKERPLKAIEGMPYAIAMQYPTPENLETVFELLAGKLENFSVSCIVVATHENLMSGPFYYPKYFCPDWLKKNQTVCQKYKVTSTALNSTALNPSEKSYRIYQLQLEAENDPNTYSIPLIYVSCWPDKGIIEQSLLKDIIHQVNSFNHKNPTAIPLFHCIAGLGRTSVLAAAFRLMDPNDQSTLVQILADMARDRSPHMIPTLEQFTLLINLAEEYVKDLGTVPER